MLPACWMYYDMFLLSELLLIEAVSIKAMGLLLVRDSTLLEVN